MSSTTQATKKRATTKATTERPIPYVPHAPPKAPRPDEKTDVELLELETVSDLLQAIEDAAEVARFAVRADGGIYSDAIERMLWRLACNARLAQKWMDDEERRS